MKTYMKYFSGGFIFLMLLSTLSFSQGKNYKFESAGLNIWYPDGWTAKEKGVVYLASKDEDINVQIELLNVPDISSAVKVAEIELKAMFPQDPSVSVNDLEVNGMRVKSIDKSTSKMHAVYYFFETPGNKFIRLFCISTNEIVEKHRATISQIVDNLKPM